jgi:hypothetical protein
MSGIVIPQNAEQVEHVFAVFCVCKKNPAGSESKTSVDREIVFHTSGRGYETSLLGTRMKGALYDRKYHIQGHASINFELDHRASKQDALENVNMFLDFSDRKK